MNNKKILFCATVDYHFQAFHLPYLKWFKDKGWEVHVAAKGELELANVDEKFNIPFARSPFSLTNLKAYRALKALIEQNQYAIIHCHTPIGGVLTRLASRQVRKQGTKVLYTAHGFHFCAGAPLINWLIYYPIERWLARLTDCLITINTEDYCIASNHGFRAGRIAYVHGVGVDIERFRASNHEDKQVGREKQGFRPDEFLMFYAAEFNANKNQQLLIRVLAKAQQKVPKARLLLAGNGPLMDSCRELALELKVAQQVDFLGFRQDLEELLPICDLAVASSLREGLPVNIMEAMACGLPVVASDNRGHRELVYDTESGWLIAPEDVEAMAAKIELIAKSNGLKDQLGYLGRELVVSRYALNKVLAEMKAVYSSFM